MKKILFICILSILLLPLTGCDFYNTGTNTEIGRIDEINNNTLVITIGTLEDKSSESKAIFNQSKNENEETSKELPQKPVSDEETNSLDDSGKIPTNEPPDKSDNRPPDLPEENGFEQPPEKPEGESSDMFSLNAENFKASDKTITVNDFETANDFKVGDLVEVTLDSSANVINVKKYDSGTKETNNGTSANTIDTEVTVSNSVYSSNSNDENALRIINGGNATLDQITIEKKGETTNSGNSNFYGLNAGILVTDSGKLTLINSKIETVGDGANGIFNYGQDSSLLAENLEINTEGNEAGGINTAGGATTNIKDSNIETQGNSSAAIRSDRGGGKVTVIGGSYITNGTGSPSIYSTADITVSDATLNSKNSEALVVEGKNSITLNNCNVTGNMNDSYNNSDENIQNIMLYQSTSGDANEGESVLSVTGGNITSRNGDMVYVTNTEASLYFENVLLELSNENLLKVSGNSSRNWGQEGKNGGHLKAVFNSQILKGNIIVDNISSLNMELTNNSEYSGVINSENSGGEINIKVDENSTWTLTGDSYITSLEANRNQINTNGFTLYVNGEKY